MMIADRYRIDGTALPGGMGAVWPCMDTVLDRKVAIKVMPGSANLRRMHDEQKALLKMRSKHVVQVYDLLRINGGDLAIVQEFIEGKDFFDKGLAPKTGTEYLKLIWQIASGIADIHSLGVIHRDIKPNNMKIDHEGVVKIFDFGLARDEGPKALTQGFVGTHGFAAPELYAVQPEFTAAIDTYAFGATALFLGYGELVGELIMRPPVFPQAMNFSTLPFKLDNEVVGILNSCLYEGPADRPPMQVVRDILARHLLHGKHKALVVYDRKANYLDVNRSSVKIALMSKGSIEIKYNGIDFIINGLDGDIFVNNRQMKVGDKLPGSCVVAFGAPEIKNDRRYVTFDLSNPEVVL